MTDRFVTDFETLEAASPLRAMRTAAMARFVQLGLPHRKMEEWRFTDVAPVAKNALPLARPGTNGVGAEAVARLGLGAGLVFVDGHFRADLSSPGAPPPGTRLMSLGRALEAERGLVERHLGRLARTEERAFVALNTAFLADGTFLYLPRGGCLALPLHLLYISTGGRTCHPRNLYVLEESAHATVVESYVSLGDQPSFVNALSEAVVGPNASLDLCKLQCENERALHVSSLHVEQQRYSNFASHTVTLGGAFTRNDVDADLDAENVNCTLNGLFMTRGSQHVDNHTRIEHRRPHCDSHELYKGILDDRSTGVFSGRIHVFEDAQKTDAKQSCANLLLSDEAVVDVQPQLEIYADDVKCTHGATIGQLDEQALFYLRSRGIGREDARTILIRAFAADVTDRIRVDPVRARIESLLAARLPR